MKPVGCDRCRQIGYKGRMGLFEIFEIDDDVRHMINRRSPTLLLRKRARELGMRTLREDGVRKVCLPLGLVDVKVVRFSDTHTAEKFVIPVSSRS